MKIVSILMMVMCMMLPLSACESSSNPNEVEVPIPAPSPDASGDNSSENTTQMNITVNGHTLTATLDNNMTAQAFAAKLPITLPMMDLYGREMCYRFPEALPTDDAKTRGYEVGEIVYYPPMHSFVIMYKQNGEHFQMQSIGRVQGDVSIFDGIGDVNVTFTKANTTSVNSAKAHATSVKAIGNIVNVKGNGTLNVTVFDSKGGTLKKKRGKDSVAVDCNGFHGMALVQVKGKNEALTLKKLLIK